MKKFSELKVGDKLFIKRQNEEIKVEKILEIEKNDYIGFIIFDVLGDSTTCYRENFEKDFYCNCINDDWIDFISTSIDRLLLETID